MIILNVFAIILYKGDEMHLKTVRKRTAYGADKINKAENFELLNKNYCKKGQTVLVGDSITEMFNHTELFAEYTEKTGVSVYNRGISGDTSDRLLERLEKNVLNIKPENMVLLIGTNDLGVGADSDFIAENIEKIIEQARKRCKNINIIIEAVYPVNTKISKQGRRKNKDIAVLNAKIKDLSLKHHVHYLDLTAVLSDESGMLHSKYTYDGLHVNAMAFEIIAKEIIALLK